MKKILLRTFSLTLIAICLFTAASCSQKEDEVFDVDLIPEKQALNFNGDELVYMAMERDGRIEIDPWDAAEDSYWTEQLKNRYKKIEEKYNLDIRIEVHDGMLVQNYYAGLEWADFSEARADNVKDFMYGGYLLPLNDFDGFLENIEDGMWGTENALNYMKRGDNYYGFQAEYHGIPFRHMCSVFYANNTVLSKYGYNLMELIENGQWTWDGFESVIETIGNDYKNEEADIGFMIQSGFPQYFATAAAASNGVEFVTVDENGDLKTNINDKKFIEAMEWAEHLVSDGLATYATYGSIESSNLSGYARFANNLCAFLCEYSYFGTTDKGGFMFTDPAVDFSICPCPCGPSGEYGKWAGIIANADRYFTVPITADTEKINAVLYDIYSPLGDSKYEWREVIASHNFIHSESAELYFTMSDNAVVCYEDALNNIPFDSIFRGGKSITEVIESSLDKVQATLDENYNKYNK